MSKRYTAQEMRDYADAIAGDLGDNDHGGVEYFYDDLIPVIESLRQAADELEREKKYEYGAFGRVFSTLNAAMLYAEMNRARGVRPAVVRREVGEWEEVTNED